MNNHALILAIGTVIGRMEAAREALRGSPTHTVTMVGDLDRVIELAHVVRRIADGKTLDRAMGAPGDWGYQTEIGKALAADAE